MHLPVQLRLQTPEELRGTRRCDQTRALAGALYIVLVQSLNARVHQASARDGKESRMASGTIKRIQRDKGFGFIRDNSGQEYFFHRSAVEGDFDSLSEGQRVSFEEEQSPKGPRAGSVRPE
jgi:CspA family cold shock protein